jgi:hypothetical protein
LSYYEICDNLNNGWKSEWSTEHQSPFAYNNEEWVGYDNVDSMNIKAKYIVDNNLAGGMFWAVDIDDFTGKHCNQGKFPLINTVKKYLNENRYVIKTEQANMTSDKKQILDYKDINEEIAHEFEMLIDIPSVQIYETKTPMPAQVPVRISTPIPKQIQTPVIIPTLIPIQTTVPELVIDVRKTSEFVIADPKINNVRQSNLQIHNLKTDIFRKMKRLTESKEKGFRDDFVCAADGMFPDKTSGCIVFYNCLWVNTPWSKKFKNICPEKTIFNSKYQICDWEEKVVCE